MTENEHSMGDTERKPAGECDFCGHRERAGGVTRPHRIKTNSEIKNYRMLCPVAVTELERLGLLVTEAGGSGGNTIGAGGETDA